MEVVCDVGGKGAVEVNWEQKRSRILMAKRLFEQGVIRIPQDDTIDALEYAMDRCREPQVIVTDGYEVIAEPAQLPEPRD